jgi:predicted nucleic acid-binding protein
MAILIDADVIFQAERGLFDFERWLTSQPDEEFKIAAITVAELWYGVERGTGAHRAKRRLFLQHFLPVFEFVAYTEKAAAEHARLWAEMESTSHLIGAHDMMLAAIALHAGGFLATFSKRHFASIKGLTIITPA